MDLYNEVLLSFKCLRLNKRDTILAGLKRSLKHKKSAFNWKRLWLLFKSNYTLGSTSSTL